MQKGKKVAIVLLAGIAAAALSYYFLIYKPAHTAVGPPTPSTGGMLPKSNTGLSTSVVGRTAYSKANGILVLNANGSTYKSASTGEWVGTIQGTEMKGGVLFYIVSGNRYVAAAGVNIR